MLNSDCDPLTVKANLFQAQNVVLSTIGRFFERMFGGMIGGGVRICVCFLSAAKFFGLLVCVLLPFNQAVGLEFYVATNGNETNEGSKENPFSTLDQARDHIRRLKMNGDMSKSGVTVFLRGGVYNLTKTFELKEEDSGGEAAPIIYEGYPGEEVRITGGKCISNFEKVEQSEVLSRLSMNARGKVFRFGLKDEGISDFGEMKHRGMGLPIQASRMELFFEDQPMVLARWPNEGFVLTGEVVETGSKVFSMGSVAGIIHPHKSESQLPGKFRFKDQRIRSWKHFDRVWLHGYFGRDWSDEYLKVESFDYADSTISLSQPTRYGHYPDKRFYFLNVLEELDQPGEWYLEETTGLLYFWPFSPIAKGNTCVSILDGAIVSVQNASHLVLRNLVVEVGRGDGIQITGGKNNIISRCIIRNVGNRGIMINGGEGHGIERCDISGTGDGGVYVLGGDRRTLMPGRHYVENNHIYRFSRWCRTYRPAVSLNGVGNRACHNSIHEGDHVAIELNGNDLLVEYNEIYDVVKDTTDAGALYIARNPTFRGNIVRYNYFHHINSRLSKSGQFGVYIDDGASGTMLNGNVFYHVGGGDMGSAIMINGGKDNWVSNNLFLNCISGVSVHSWKPVDWTRYLKSELIEYQQNEVESEGSPYSERYPALKKLSQEPGVNEISNNISYGCKNLVILKGERTEQHVESNLVAEEETLFVDFQGMDFRVKESALIDKDFIFEPIPFERIGVVPD